MTIDPFNLQRFIDAQEGLFERALGEISRGHKRGHWIWFIFPQVWGLGRTATAQRYAIASLDEARAYLAHPLLGRRLTDCVQAFQDLENTTAAAVFGDLDAIKVRSSLTLFWRAGGGAMFETALTRWFSSPDPLTTELVDRGT